MTVDLIAPGGTVLATAVTDANGNYLFSSASGTTTASAIYGIAGLTTNTSSGMNAIIDALEGAGEVISCDLEFPVSTIPWMHRGISVQLVKTVDGELRLDDVRAAMTGNICRCSNYNRYVESVMAAASTLSTSARRKA